MRNENIINSAALHAEFSILFFFLIKHIGKYISVL